MKQQTSLRTLSLLSLVCFLTACVSTGTPRSSQQAHSPTKSSGTMAKIIEFPLQGCLTGALAGGLGGLAVGDKDDRGQNTLLGAALGCAAGAAIGYHIGQRTDHYANQSQAIDAEIKRSEENVQMLSQYNKQLHQKLSYYRSQVRRIQMAQKSQQAKQEDLAQVKLNVSEQVRQSQYALNNVNEELATAKKQYETYRVQATYQRNQEWEQKLAALEQEKQILNKHVASLMQLNASI